MPEEELDVRNLAIGYVIGRQSSLSPENQRDVYNGCFKYIGLKSRFSIREGRLRTSPLEGVTETEQKREDDTLTSFLREMDEAYRKGTSFEEEKAAVQGVLNRYSP